MCAGNHWNRQVPAATDYHYRDDGLHYTDNGPRDMSILLPGLVTGLLVKSVGELLIMAALCGLGLHALPRILKSLRDIRVIRSMSEADKVEARTYGVRVDSAARLTPMYAIAVHALIGVVGTVVVACLVAGIKMLAQ